MKTTNEIKFKMLDWDENESSGKNHSEIFCYNNCELVFLIRIDNETNKIEWVESYSKGYYKMTLIAALKMGYDYLISSDRNSFSNPVYQKWINHDIRCSSEVTISLNNEELVFNF